MTAGRRWFGAASCLLAGALLLAMTGACTNSRSSAAVRLTVDPSVSVADQRVLIRVSGLTPGEQTTIRVQSTDSKGVPWRSTATYRASSAGVVDARSAAAMSGTYHGVSGMGLIWSMRPSGPAPAGAYSWKRTAPMTFGLTVTVHDTRVAAASFRRKRTDIALATHLLSAAANGFTGQFVEPQDSTKRHAAVLVIGGSEGGLSNPLLLAELANHGVPTLGVAYFGAPGLPKTLSNIPLEYFAEALTWLAHQRGVDPQHIAVLGISRGSEAAQLLGVHYPNLVHAVIASVPSNSAICSFPDCDGPAWTLRGRALPYTRDFNDPSPDDEPDAVIFDQRIHGPVFLDCAGNDQTWHSCPYAEAIMGLLDGHHHRWKHELHAYPTAGHHVGGLLPYEPLAPPAATDPSHADDQQAKAKLWPALLRFLEQFATTPVT